MKEYEMGRANCRTCERGEREAGKPKRVWIEDLCQKYRGIIFRDNSLSLFTQTFWRDGRQHTARRYSSLP